MTLDTRTRHSPIQQPRHRQGMREAILAVYQDRKNLAATLKDTKTVVGTLERIMAVVIQLVFFFVYLLIWNVSTLLRKASPHACRRDW